MATEETPRMDEQASDREHAQLSLSDIEEEVLAVPETGTSGADEVGVEVGARQRARGSLRWGPKDNCWCRRREYARRRRGSDNEPKDRYVRSITSRRKDTTTSRRRSGKHKHDTKHTAVLPRFGALARGNARTSCMSDHIYESRAEGRRATKMLLELYV